jgi:hypothetical protein
MNFVNKQIICDVNLPNDQKLEQQDGLLRFNRKCFEPKPKFKTTTSTKVTTPNSVSSPIRSD